MHKAILLSLAFVTFTGCISAQNAHIFNATVSGAAPGEYHMFADVTHYVGLKAPVGGVSTNIVWEMPSIDGTAGTCLSTDGSGVLSWGACSAGGGLTIPVDLTAGNSSHIMSLTQTSTGIGLVVLSVGGRAGSFTNTGNSAIALQGSNTGTAGTGVYGITVGGIGVFGQSTGAGIGIKALSTSTGDALLANNGGGSGYAVHSTSGDSLFEGSVKIGVSGSNWSIIPTVVSLNPFLTVKNPSGTTMLHFDQVNSSVFSDASFVASGTLSVSGTSLFSSTATFNSGAVFNSTTTHAGTDTFNGASIFNSTLTAVTVSATSTVLAAGDISTSTGIIGAYGGEVDIRGPANSFRGTDILNKNGVTIHELWYTGTDNSTQSGSNVGADYIIQRWNDAGSIIDSPITITRSSGLVTFADATTHTGTATFNGSVAGAHLQNLGTSDNPQFANITSTSIGSFNILTTSGGIITAGISSSASGGNINFSSSGTGNQASNFGSAFSFSSLSDVNGTCRIGFASGGVTCPSDVRLKTNIVDMPSALERMMRLRPVRFDWLKSGEPADGLIAQEVMEVFPLSVHAGPGDAGPDTLHVSYTQLVPYIIGSVQEQQAEIIQLRADIDAIRTAKK